MKINNLNLNCQKPRHFGSSVTTESSTKKKLRYKSFEQMDDKTLMLRSIIKAHKDVNKSNKMKLYKAMPAIATGIIGTTLAITQTGNLSSKLASGLGFLVAAKLVEKTSDSVDKIVDKNWADKEDSSNVLAKTVIKAGATFAGASLAALALYKGGQSVADHISKSSGGLAKILKSDASQLVSEINNSKLGKFVSEKVMPFDNKLQKANILAPIAAIIGLVGARSELSQSITDDINNKAVVNFVKGKVIQQAARDEFDKIDAKEV